MDRKMKNLQTKTNKQIMFNWIGAPLLILYLILKRIWRYQRVIRIHKSKKSRQPAPMRGGFSRYIGPGLGEPRRTLWISEQPHSLSLNHWSFILIFSLYLVFSTIFSVLSLPVVLLNLKPSIWESMSQPVPGPQKSCSALVQ
jgi:hypothetical protein